MSSADRIVDHLQMSPQACAAQIEEKRHALEGVKAEAASVV